ncbi:MAG: calcineurin-like phosphoesterase C-terminal domain-containing protein [Alistipes sp.]|nr:calcineurin-like phosphoesterase C-terminal domain-containing protein [Alistipes sp.]
MKKLLIILVALFAVSTVAQASSHDVSGTIRTVKGAPIEGVVVSDGYTVVATNAEGFYSFDRHPEASYVYYSLPAEYEVPLRQGHPCFYKKLTDDRVYDFVLRPMKGGVEKNFHLFFLADPQCQNLRHVHRFRSETAPDVRQMAKKCKYNCYAISLGDIVYSEGPRNANYLMPMIKNEMAAENLGMPMFQTIGNHDCDYEPVSLNNRNSNATVRLQRMFEATFGPIDYSWNRGDVHIVSMNDIVYDDITNFKKYHGDFTDKQVEWLREDLKYVSKDKMVILCVHIPVEHFRKSKNNKAVLAMLSEFANCRIVSGHTHYMRHFTHANGIREHILAAASGCWWWSRNNGDGAPNGYAIFDIKGNQVADDIYKGVGFDKSYQLRLYRGDATVGGKHESPTLPFGPDKLLANVWYANKDWKVEVYENGKLTGEMKRMKPSPFRDDEHPSLTSSKDWWAICYHTGVVGRGHRKGSTRRNYCSPNHHMYIYTMKDPSAKIKVVATDSKGRKYTCDHVITGQEYDLAAPPVYQVGEVW